MKVFGVDPSHSSTSTGTWTVPIASPTYHTGSSASPSPGASAA